MIPAEAVAGAYRRLLHREPSAEDRATYAAGAPDLPWLEHELRASVEHRTVVGPLRRLLVAEWERWAFRRPSAPELQHALAVTRARCGGDEGVRRFVTGGGIDTKLAFRPLKVEMDITNQCNLRCVMCSFSLPEYHGAPRRHLSGERFEELAGQVFARCHEVSLSYGTEPLLHRDLAVLLEVLARYEVPHTYMNTNALLLTEKTVEAMIRHRFSFLFVSVDAATRETYERIRVKGSFERLLAKLEMLRECKRAHGVEHPALGLGFVLMRQNMAELPAFVELAARVGARSVNAMHMVAWEQVGNAGMAAHHDKERCNEALAAAHRRATGLGITLVAPAPFRLGSTAAPLVADTRRRGEELGVRIGDGPRTGCPFPWGFAAIDPRGNVFPCGWWDAATHGPMGNVHESDFLTIWRGPAFRDLRARLLAHRLEGSCAQCPAAGMGAPEARGAFAPRPS